MTVVVAPLRRSEKVRFHEVFTSVQASGLLPGYCTYVFVRFSSSYGHREMCPPELNLGLIPRLESFVMRNEYLNKVEDNASNEFQELRDIWAQWDDEAKQLFYQNYGDLPYLLDIKVDKHLFRAMVQFWNPAYSCFTFGEVDLVPTLEEYTTLLRCPKIQGNKAYVRPANLPTFMKKLMMIMGMSEQWAAARVQQKGDGKCIPWSSLRDLILAHPNMKRRVDVLALSIYGLVIFPKALGHIDEAVADLFDRLGKQNKPVPAILSKTFRSLSACRRAGEGRFIRCAHLLLVWFHSHFWKVDKVPYRVFFKNYSPLKEAAATPRRDDITEERWIEILQNLREEDVMWKASWMTPSEILYRCGSFDWVPLPGIWEVVGDHYKKKMREIFEAWKKTEFGVARLMEENLRVIPSELEVIKKEFKRKNLELGKRIERLDEEKMYLSLDVNMQYKKTQLSMKRAGLGKSLKQWQQEVQEERAKAKYWEKKFQEIQAQN
ncbi:hypothetical protein CXB51_024755 [Gossypium anomalum]|uniref:DUF7745 domain-containing protein n=1 Tax=Gossypium anomalum TaxID=47600 RepID=A0A8J5YI36_9ROSI|nr:hypothetical protein CXB51_024755 [Gossypium anomalum]